MNEVWIMLRDKAMDVRDLLYHIDMNGKKEDALLVRTMLNEAIDLNVGIEVYMKKNKIGS